MEGMSGQENLVQKIKQQSVVLSDLDGLLVNSENFNQVFIQRTDAQWIQRTIDRVVRSEMHLKKLIQVLIKFIVSEHYHPDWADHALRWLKQLLTSHQDALTPAVLEICKPLLSFATQMSALKDLFQDAAIRGRIVNNFAQTSKDNPLKASRYHCSKPSGLPSTGYVYVDDSDEELALRKAKKLRHSSNQTSSSHVLNAESDDASDAESFLEEEEGDDDEVEDEEDVDSLMQYGVDAECDDGVFDVSSEEKSEELVEQPQRELSSDEQESQLGLSEDETSSSESEALDLMMWNRQADDEEDDADDGEEEAEETIKPQRRSPRKQKREQSEQDREPESDRRVTRQQSKTVRPKRQCVRKM